MFSLLLNILKSSYSAVKTKSFIIAIVLSFGTFANANEADAVLTIDSDSFTATAWSWSAYNTGSVHSGGGGGSGIANFGDLTLELSSNRFSVKLLELLASGTQLSEVTLTDGNLTLLMEGVLVRAVVASKPEKHIAELQFSKFTYSTNSFSTCFNIQLNAAC